MDSEQEVDPEEEEEVELLRDPDDVEPHGVNVDAQAGDAAAQLEDPDQEVLDQFDKGREKCRQILGGGGL